MWKMLCLASLVFLLALLPAIPADAATQVLTGVVRWHGEVTLDDPVRVEPGATLVIAAGTVVRPANPAIWISVAGQLQVAGTRQQPVVFASPPGWQGIDLAEPTGPSSFDYAEFSGAEAAIKSIAAHFSVRNCTFRNCETAIQLVRESDPLIENCTFEGNGLAVANEMKSNATIRGNLFRGQTKSAIMASHNSRGTIQNNRFERNVQGIALLQRYNDSVLDNTFTDNKLAIYCNQTQNSPQISGNTFARNEIALVDFSFAYPAVENNLFTDNKTAIHNDQFGSPLVSHNLFQGNDTAIYNNRKSNPVIRNNRIEKSELAIFCDYSSYPEVRNNNFLGNRVAVKLGIYQSADWEKRSGSKSLMAKQSAQAKSQNPLLAKAPTTFPDTVDVSENWWGEDTARMERDGTEANLKIFYDRNDLPTVTYEDFGPESYTLDIIRYAPWLTAPVVGVGPVEAGR
ncbi:hypothetical protein JCM30471_16360 [Desulfuromonas carbonis]|uniref:right-handed parallel beta-helix repeat-containing protein n=1 Tax=Desulfuromonas sp. DDH964 TaxID=1823759 RepID=UPI00078D62FA|nr:right-handed parallel beta-helix repeat-containing protein [Desulfuromonas sp. DDH964]AMV73233.1 hypothetical protein DBW_2924 [Desulfuromonas sp. DDH964]